MNTYLDNLGLNMPYLKKKKDKGKGDTLCFISYQNL